MLWAYLIWLFVQTKEWLISCFSMFFSRAYSLLCDKTFLYPEDVAPNNSEESEKRWSSLVHFLRNFVIHLPASFWKSLLTLKLVWKCTHHHWARFKLNIGAVVLIAMVHGNLYFTNGWMQLWSSFQVNTAWLVSWISGTSKGMVPFSSFSLHMTRNLCIKRVGWIEAGWKTCLLNNWATCHRL